MYMRIGIFGRCADNIYIYIDVVFTYYSKEVGSGLKKLQLPLTINLFCIVHINYIDINIDIVSAYP